MFDSLPRPASADVDRITTIIETIDNAAEVGGEVVAIASDVVDFDSLTYAAIHRAARLSRLGDGPAVLMTGWMDGFIAGAKFQKAKS